MSAVLPFLAAAAIAGEPAAKSACAAERDADACDIVVTAERRQASLANVPLSLGVLTGRDLADARLQGVRDLDARAPNLTVQPGVINGGAALFTIRGVGSSGEETLGFDNPVGFYLDGVPLVRAPGAALDLAGIARVEVLRGPQGTLFGRNTTGGAISLVTAEPAEARGAEVSLEAGSRGWREQRARLESGRVADTVRLSFGGLHRLRGGFVEDPSRPGRRRDPGSSEEIALRAAIVADAPSGWTVAASADWTRLAGNPAAGQPASLGDGSVRPPFLVDGRNITPVQPAPVLRWISAAQPVLADCPARIGRSRAGRLCLPDAATSIDRFQGAMLRLEGPLGGAQVRAVTGYRGWRNRVAGADIDGLPALRGFALTPDTLLAGLPVATLLAVPGIEPEGATRLAATPITTTDAPVFATANRRHSTQWSQEIDLRSPEGAPVNWVVGAIVIDERGRERSVQRIGLVLDIVDAVLGPRFGPLAPLLAAGLPAGSRERMLVRPDATLAYSVRNQSFAVYGQADGPLPGIANLGFSLGVRLTHDRRAIRREQNGPLPFSPDERAQNRRTIAFTSPTGHVALDWRPHDDLLAWLRLARGYQAGGWNARQPTRLATPSQTAIDLAPFAPKTIWAGELGWRWSRPGLRLSGALFLGRERNTLVSLPIPDAPTFGTLVVNAGRVDHRGFELEADVRLANWLRIEGAAGFTDTRFRRFPARADDGARVNIASLVRNPNMPRWTGSLSAIGGLPLAGPRRLEARLSWTGNGKRRFYADPITQPFQLNGGRASLFDAVLRLAAVPLGGFHGDVALWAENIGTLRPVRGVDLAQLGVGTLIYSEPRRMGLSLTVRSGPAETHPAR